jgi:hypothetical protein
LFFLEKSSYTKISRPSNSGRKWPITTNHYLQVSIDGGDLSTQQWQYTFIHKSWLYQLTVWDWKKREMILRSKSFSNDVVNVKFSLTVPGQLTTAGIAFVTYICIYNILLHNMTQSNYKVALWLILHTE